MGDFLSGSITISFTEQHRLGQHKARHVHCRANPRQLLCRRPGPPQSSVSCLVNSNNCLQKKGCGKTDAEKFEVGCYSLFKTKFIDNISIIGGKHNLIIMRLSRIYNAPLGFLKNANEDVLHKEYFFLMSSYSGGPGCCWHRAGHCPLCLLPWKEVSFIRSCDTIMFN